MATARIQSTKCLLDDWSISTLECRGHIVRMKVSAVVEQRMIGIVFIPAEIERLVFTKHI